MVQGPLLVQPEGDLCGSTDMLLRNGRSVVSDVITPPVTSIVVVARQLVEQLAPVAKFVGLKYENPRPLTIGYQHPVSPVALDDRLQLPHTRRLVHGQLVANRNRKLDDLEEVVWCAGEQGQASNVRSIHARFDSGI
jgi:hypothetical protein